MQIYEMQTCDNVTSRNCYDDEIRPLEYWSFVQMTTTVSCNTKSLIVGSGIRQWHSVGFLSWLLAMAQGNWLVCICQRDLSR